MQTIPGGVNSWYVDSVVVSKRVRTLKIYLKNQLASLRLRRLLSMAIKVFKIINKQTPVYSPDLVTIKKSSYSFRYNNAVNIPRVNTTYKNSSIIKMQQQIIKFTSTTKTSTTLKK
jgi:hypothetical protein